jgi:hypothetical protein
VVPYIGQLLGIRGLHPGLPGTFSLRAFVANTLAYRRRKGTAAMLEQLARDTTGWNARAVEYFELIRATQHINHIRAHSKSTPDLRQSDALQLLETPFDTVSHTTDIRSIARQRGKHNLDNVGLFLWRLTSYVMEGATAHAMDDPDGRCYTLNPLGCDTPLFNRPQAEMEITHLAEEINVPGRLRRLSLYRELESRRQALKVGEMLPVQYFGKQPVLEVFLGGAENPLLPEEIIISDLSGWDTAGWAAPSSEEFDRYDGEKYKSKVAIDPELGRLVLLDNDEIPECVRVSYAYGFSGDIGGGPYDRATIPHETSSEVWHKRVSKYNLDAEYRDINEAIAAWISEAPSRAVITIIDNEIYSQNIDLHLATGQELVIQAGNRQRPTLRLEDVDGQVSSLKVHVVDPTDVAFTLNGLLIEGAIEVEDESLESLRIIHCTLIPCRGVKQCGKPRQLGAVSIKVKSPSISLDLEIDHSIVGSLLLPESLKRLTVTDSVIDAQEDMIYAIGPVLTESGNNKPYGPVTTLERTTILGSVRIRELPLASEVIFSGKVEVERRQKGCMRYSYAPLESQVPRKFRCQPELALKQRAEELELESPADLDEVEKVRILDTLRPEFSSRRYSQPGYAQLSLTCPNEIRKGAENGSEMGVFHHLMQPQREANLQASLDDYLRFGLEAGIFYVT